MIVRKTWIKKKYDKVGYTSFLKENRYYVGYFLFGIIPLFIDNYKTEYLR